MQVQINLSTPFEFSAGQRIPAFNFCGDIVLTTDPGKTNMAMVVGTPFGTKLCILQFRAPGSAYNTSEYCHDFKDFISRYLSRCKVVHFAMEQAISKKGMNHHHSSMVLTEIRANLIDLAFSMTGKRPLEINNWSWKSDILPAGMRSQSEKGSLKFLPHVADTYGNADVTDAICIYMHVIKRCCGDYVIHPNTREEPLADCKVYLLPKGSKVASESRRFQYEPRLSLMENCVYFANRTWERGVATVPVDSVSLEEIYKYATGFGPRICKEEEFVEAVVVRS